MLGNGQAATPNTRGRAAAGSMASGTMTCSPIQGQQAVACSRAPPRPIAVTAPAEIMPASSQTSVERMLVGRSVNPVKPAAPPQEPWRGVLLSDH